MKDGGGYENTVTDREPARAGRDSAGSHTGAAFAATGGVASATGAPTSLNCQATRGRPHLIVFSEDGSQFLAGYRKPGHFANVYDGYFNTGKIHWTSWHRGRAVGVGAQWADDDYPSVGGGVFYLFHTRIVLSRAEHGTFTRMTVTDQTNVKRHSHEYVPHHIQRFRATSCGGGKWSWNSSRQPADSPDVRSGCGPISSESANHLAATAIIR